MILSEMENAKGNRHKKADQKLEDDSVSSSSLESLGITPKQSSRWQQEAKVSDEDFAKMVTEVNNTGEELTQAKLLKLSRGAHVGNNSCDNEWYTPEEYIQPFRDMVGGIDVDPASCEFANRQVKAKKFYSIDQDGLTKTWKGNVWLNPPYGSGAVEPFIDKLIQEIESGRVSHMAVLVNNATETKWFQRLLANVQAVCFLASRIKFLKPSAEKNSPLQGQVICYAGNEPGRFSEAYIEIGITLFAKGTT